MVDHLLYSSRHGDISGPVRKLPGVFSAVPGSGPERLRLVAGFGDTLVTGGIVNRRCACGELEGSASRWRKCGGERSGGAAAVLNPDAGWTRESRRAADSAIGGDDGVDRGVG